MKKVLFFLIMMSAISFVSHGQSGVNSLGFNYSALVRDTAGRVQPLKAVKLKFTLLLGQNGTETNSPWIETQNATTDAYGFVNVTIGNGIKAGGTAGSFAFVDFTLANYWILIEVFNNFTSAYEPLAKQALQAVPYAKVAGALTGGQIIPAGTIVAFGGDNQHIPAGWLLCDGSEVDNTDPIFTNLFNAIGYNWGTSNHANKFNIPNTQGLFLRGVSNGGTLDPDVSQRVASTAGANGGDAVGSFQNDAFQGHKHLIAHNTPINQGSNSIGGTYTQSTASVQTGLSDVISFPAISGNPITNDQAYGAIKISSESRPKNIYVNYIIKY